MNKYIMYTYNKQIDSLFKLKHFIPYKMSPNIKYETGQMYYSDYWRDYFKTISVNYKNNLLDNAYIKWHDGNYGLICTDPDYADYRLEKDKKELYKENCIINNNKVYSGAEIIYWFWIHNINSDNEKYNGYWKFLDKESGQKVSDYSQYKLFGKLINEKFVACRLQKVSTINIPIVH